MSKKQINLFNFCLFAVLLAYAFIRYNLAKQVPLVQFPVYVLNKALAYLALANFGLLLIPDRLFLMFLGITKKEGKDFFLNFAFFSLFMHIILSLIVLNNSYFPKLITIDNQLTLSGSWSMLLASIAFVLFLLISFRKVETDFYFIFLVSILAHLFFLGGSSWIKVSEWPWYLPPISLLAFLDSLFILFLYLKGKSKNKG